MPFMNTFYSHLVQQSLKLKFAIPFYQYSVGLPPKRRIQEKAQKAGAFDDEEDNDEKISKDWDFFLLISGQHSAATCCVGE